VPGIKTALLLVYSFRDPHGSWEVMRRRSLLAPRRPIIALARAGGRQMQEGSVMGGAYACWEECWGTMVTRLYTQERA